MEITFDLGIFIKYTNQQIEIFTIISHPVNSAIQLGDYTRDVMMTKCPLLHPLLESTVYMVDQTLQS